VFAVVYSLISEYINYRLSLKNMSEVTLDYVPVPQASPKKENKKTTKKK